MKTWYNWIYRRCAKFSQVRSRDHRSVRPKTNRPRCGAIYNQLRQAAVSRPQSFIVRIERTFRNHPRGVAFAENFNLEL